jgi:hypothetical protein
MLVLAEAYSTIELEDMFYLPLSTVAYQDLQDLKQLMENNPVLDQHDVWSYCWGRNTLQLNFITRYMLISKFQVFTGGFGNHVASCATRCLHGLCLETNEG